MADAPLAGTQEQEQEDDHAVLRYPAATSLRR